MFVIAFISAGVWPLMGLLLADLMFSLIGLTYAAEEFKPKMDMALLKFGLFCIGIGLFKGMEQTLFGVAGENLTCKVRNQLMKEIIYKQLSWFDREDKAPGVLTNIMAEDISSLNGMTTETLSLAVQAGMGLLFATLLSMYFDWRTCLWTTLCSPVLWIGIIGMNKL
jgi:ABC-type multidrug transport system fused ATPase/permease subunit